MDKENLFRISALMYSESEGIKKKETIIRRIIEAVIVEDNNSLVTVQELIYNIKNQMDIIVLETEIKDLLAGKTRKHFEIIDEGELIKFRLTRDRYEYLKNSSRKNIGEYIDEYIKLNGFDDNSKEIIYRYIYKIYQGNISDFNLIMQGNCSIQMDDEDEIFSEQAEIINGFLEWKNEEKDKAIMALLSYALEYSMLTCNSNVLFGTRLGDVFKNKRLYIDTNIIFYCLGINGSEFQFANELLLDKCNASQESLYITQYTDLEFRNTLKHYVEEIKKFDSSLISKINYHAYITEKDIYLYYLEWKKKMNVYKDTRYFEKDILGKYDKWIKKYNVTIDKEIPYDDENLLDLEIIERYTQEIPYKGNINYDAHNIFWIEKKREKQKGNDRVNTEFGNTSYFILSPHNLLKHWDYARNTGIPVIVSPHIWLTLLTRFVSRSSNDYECFKNFINIKTQDQAITNKEFFSIIKAIEDVTDDLEQQEYIIDVVVEDKFKYLNSKETRTAEDVEQETKKEANKILESKVNELSKKIDSLREEVDENKKKSAYSLEEKDEKLRSKDKEIKEKNTTIENMKNKEINRKLRHRRIINGILVIVPTILFVWQLWDLFLNKNPNNLVVNWILYLVKDTLLKDKGADILLILIQIAFTVIVGFWDYKLTKIFYDDDTLIKVKDKLRKKL